MGATITVAQDKPNVIFILADDLGYGDLSILNPQSKITTPHIDQLAKGGMIFTDAHSPSSVCTPTRYGILTGQYGWRSKQKKGVSRQYDPPLIDQSTYTVGKLFQERNYVTACIGKWHLGWDWPMKDGRFIKDAISGLDASAAERLELEKQIDFSSRLSNGPITRGFDLYYGDDVPNYPPYCFIENDKTIGLLDRYKPDEMYGHAGLMSQGWSLENVMPAITQKAVDFITDRANKKESFFLYFALTSPHVPIAPSIAFKGKSGAGSYGDFVMETDWAVGQIMQTLQSAGIDKNTMVIFTSDNGSTGQDGTNMSGEMNSVLKMGHNPHEPFRGMKTDLWEGGHHVPFIVSWPEMIKAGTIEKRTICHTDFMATCAAILNKKIPAGQGIDSYSLMPLLKGKNEKQYKRPYTIHHSSEGFFAIRKGKWKLILTEGSGGGLIKYPMLSNTDGNVTPFQLYDMEDDPKEQKNLFAERADIIKELMQILRIEGLL